MPESAPQGRWTDGLSWNYASLVVAGLAGLVTNVAIARRFGPEGLGVFSQTLMWFILVAQVAALGIHYAVLQRTASAVDITEARSVVDAAFTTVLVVSAVVASTSALLAPVVGSIVGSAPVGESIRFASIGLVLHALTKVVAAGLNGVRRMRAFSFVSATRFLGMLLGVSLLAAADSPVEALGLVLVVGEAAALGVAVVAWGGVTLRMSFAESKSFVKYGARATPAAVTVEANSRVDIAVLAVLASDSVVGIYALAATAYESLFQVFVVLRNQVNPNASLAIRKGRPHEVVALQDQLRPWTLAVSVGALIISVLFFESVVGILGLVPDFVDARTSLLILLLGLFFASPLLPFDQLLVVAGEPAAQSWVVALSVTINVVLNLALVPSLGMAGAAIGTACALLTLVIGVWRRSRSLLGTSLHLWPFPAVGGYS